VILVDANLLLYAHDQTSPDHDKARVWWDQQLSGTLPVCLCWSVINTFLRISTNRRIFSQPLELTHAVDYVQAWLGQKCVRIVAPTEQHWSTYRRLLLESQSRGNLVMDAHLAAIAIDHGCVMCSADHDFSRFKGLKWKNPLASP
jgi:uncharacterized protein